MASRRYRRLDSNASFWSLVLTCAIAVGSVEDARTADCEERGFQKVEGDLGYQDRDGFCEGLYESPVASDFEVVSLVRGTVDLEAANELVIRVPTLTGDYADLPIAVTAVAMRPRTYYRMDATLASGGVHRWDPAVVLNKIHLTGRELGIYATTAIADKLVFVPVDFDDKPQLDPSSAPVQPLELLLRAGVDIELLAWRQTRKGEEWPTGYEEGTGARAGTSISIPLSGLDSGLVDVEVVAKPADSDVWLTRVMRIVITGR